MARIMDAINWWENKLTPSQRKKYLGRKSWSGTVNQRHKKLLRFYKSRNKK